MKCASPNSYEVVDQTTLAEIFGVDRTTIRAWQQKGLPHERHRSKLLFRTALAVHWHIGAEILRKHGISVPAEKPLAVAMVSSCSDLINPRRYTEKKDVLREADRLAKVMGATRVQILVALVEAAILRRR